MENNLSHDQLAAHLASHLSLRLERITWLNFAPCSDLAVRPDVFSIRRTLDVRRCQPWTCEIKVSRGDYWADVRREKWRKYRRFSCRVFFATPANLIGLHELPPGAGLIEYKPQAGVWRIKRAAGFCPDWQLTSRDLMKMILGRWGTAGHLLPAERQIGSGPISEADRRELTEGQWPKALMAPDTGNPTQT